ncbi:MAG: Gfo/Idh/MocA family oxidoreductase [candidate division Zixibacteria bacterium]|nr:Gfo/Idh/MocA family oxidoreductase [candidate division Zixibacteria bacterium]
MKTLFRISESAGSEKKLKIVFFGLGSIGSRLARLIRDNYNHDLYAFRSQKKDLNDLGIDEVYEINEVERLSPDVAFITNPTSLHVDTAIRSASMGIHLFIEKPLCNSLVKCDSLLGIVQKKRVLTYVACNLRFDPIIQYLKRTLDLNRIFYSRAICSSYLPDWRPNQDYKNSYSVRKELGGGVVLDLIHEPDYCHWLFGPISKINGTGGKCSHFEIETEDFADMNLHHSSGFLSNIHLNYFGRKLQRKIEIFGNNLYIEADLIERTVITVNEEGNDIQKFDPIDRDYTYEQELKYFFQCLNDHEVPMNNIEEHRTVLKPVLEFKENLGL